MAWKSIPESGRDSIQFSRLTLNGMICKVIGRMKSHLELYGPSHAIAYQPIEST